MTITLATPGVDAIEPRTLAARLARHDPVLVLRDRGFTRVMVLRGGLAGWRRAGLATEPFGRESVGDVVLGVVGSRARHTVTLVGPSVHLADAAFEVPGTDGLTVALWTRDEEM